MRSGIFVILILIAVTVSAVSQTPDVSFATLDARCTRVVDGDTLVLQGGETVRLLGIDTPELGQPYANDAKWALHDWVAHKPLRLELDVETRDAYNRLLAFVYVESDDGWILVNAELVRAGLAKLLFIPPNTRYYGYFLDVLEQAKLQRRGMWEHVGACLSVPALEEDLTTYITKLETVEFTIGEVAETSRYLTLYSVEGDYGFYVKIPAELLPSFDLGPPLDWVGDCAIITGIVDCERVGRGPSILVEYVEQLILPCPDSQPE